MASCHGLQMERVHLFWAGTQFQNITKYVPAVFLHPGLTGNITTGETSWALASSHFLNYFHFFDHFHFFDYFHLFEYLHFFEYFHLFDNFQFFDFVTSSTIPTSSQQHFFSFNTITKIWSPGGATCNSWKFGHQVTPLASVENFATTWHHLYYF